MALYKNKFIELDPETCDIEELKNAIELMESYSGFYETKQLAIKTFLNSVYGATASVYFVAHNLDVAESITLQGQDLNHFSENSVNTYFIEVFQTPEEINKVIYPPLQAYSEKFVVDKNTPVVNAKTKEPCAAPDSFWKVYQGDLNTEFPDDVKNELYGYAVKTTLGEYLKITYDDIKDFTIDKGRLKTNVYKPTIGPEFSHLEHPELGTMTVAGDTDSIYVEFGRLTNYLNITDPAEASRFVVDLWNFGTGAYMKQKYEEYAKAYNCDENLEELELEKIADTTLLTGKKHYVMSKCFAEPNIYYKPGTHISYTGLEPVQGSTPEYAKKCLKDFMDFLVIWFGTHNEKPDFNTLYDMIKGYKAGLARQSPDDICKLWTINDYNKHILDDKNSLVIADKAPFHVKAAGYANYLLNRPENKKYRTKYNTIKPGDKVRVYQTSNPNYPYFAFTPLNFPVEYAPAMNYDEIFNINILSRINSILTILGYKELTSTLCYSSPLF